MYSTQASSGWPSSALVRGCIRSRQSRVITSTKTRCRSSKIGSLDGSIAPPAVATPRESFLSRVPLARPRKEHRPPSRAARQRRQLRSRAGVPLRYVSGVETQEALTDALQRLALELPAKVQRVEVAEDDRVLVELFPGRKLWVALASQGPAPLLALVTSWTRDIPTPPRVQAILRRELIPSRLVEVQRDSAELLSLRFERIGGEVRWLRVERTARDPRLLLTGAPSGDRVRGVIGETRAVDGRDLREGRMYERPRSPSAPDDAGAASLLTTHATVTPRKTSPAESPLQARLKGEHRRLRRLIGALEADLARHGDPTQLTADGELLKTWLSQVPRGATLVTLQDFDGSSRTVCLEPSLSPSQNLERLFRRARRARAGAGHIAPRLADAIQRRDELEAARAVLASGSASPAQLQAFAALLDAPPSARGSARRRAALTGPRRPYRSFQLREDVVAKVGRSAKDNDALTFHVAKGNDLWLHTRDVAGCHVVVPQQGRDLALSHEILLDAAHLAIWFSPSRHASRADVRYAPRKHVRKPGRGAPAGLVHVSHERVIHIVVEPARIQRLLANEVASS